MSGYINQSSHLIVRASELSDSTIVNDSLV